MYGPRIGGGGLGRYVEELVGHLPIKYPQNKYVLFLGKDNFAAAPAQSPFEKRLVDIPWYSWEEQVSLPPKLREAKVDLMHFPHWNVPLFYNDPFVVTIHDTILLEDKNSARATLQSPLMHALKTVAFRAVIEHAVHASKAIITVSNSAKAGILKYFRVNPEKIKVIYHGVTIPQSGSGVSLEAIGVRSPYFLVVGNAYPHKNIPVVLEAFSRLLNYRPETQLVIAGKYDGFAKLLALKAQSLGIPDPNLRFIHIPTDQELGALYRHCSALLFPSLIEGFGWPPLEATLVGRPVLASNIPVMREILGAGEWLLPTNDPISWCNAMLSRLDSPHSFSGDISLIKKRAMGYNWSDTGLKTSELYLSCVKRKLA